MLAICEDSFVSIFSRREVSRSKSWTPDREKLTSKISLARLDRTAFFASFSVLIPLRAKARFPTILLMVPDLNVFVKSFPEIEILTPVALLLGVCSGSNIETPLLDSSLWRRSPFPSVSPPAKSPFLARFLATIDLGFQARAPSSSVLNAFCKADPLATVPRYS